jgi:hypothetical protein
MVADNAANDAVTVAAALPMPIDADRAESETTPDIPPRPVKSDAPAADNATRAAVAVTTARPVAMNAD